jgi:uncharacterized protein YbcI
VATDPTSDTRHDDELEALGDSVCAIHEELCGVRPDSAQCVLAGSVLACAITGGLTPIERTLVDRRLYPEAREYREAVIDAESARFQQAVEAGLGRPVASKVHVFDPANAVTTLVFVLEPALATSDERRAILAWATQVRSQAERQRALHRQLRDTQRRLATEVERTRERVHPKR